MATRRRLTEFSIPSPAQRPARLPGDDLLFILQRDLENVAQEPVTFPACWWKQTIHLGSSYCHIKGEG